MQRDKGAEGVESKRSARRDEAAKGEKGISRRPRQFLLDSTQLAMNRGCHLIAVPARISSGSASMRRN